MTEHSIAPRRVDSGANSRREATPRLGCVAVPIISFDIERNLGELFALWADKRFMPDAGEGAGENTGESTGASTGPHLMVAVNRATDAELAQIESLYRDFPTLAASFSGFSAQSCDLEGERDIYAREGDPRWGEKGPAFGRKAGPNFLFQRTIEMAAAYGGFTLQVELDCLPVGPGWLAAVDQVIDDHPRAWVIGSHYAGGDSLGADVKSHMNGNALYHAGDPRFRTFLSDVWMPRIQHQIATRPDLAYDCWWAVERHEADARANNKSWQLFQLYDSFFHADPFVVNLLVPEAGTQGYRRVFERFEALGVPPVFLHGPAMNAVRRAALQQPADTLFEIIDHLDPAPVSTIRNPRSRERLRTGRSSRDRLSRDRQSLDRFSTDQQDKVQSSCRLLLQAAADLLNPGSNRSSNTDVPDHAQAIHEAITTLAADHPARVHYDGVCAFAKNRDAGT